MPSARSRSRTVSPGGSFGCLACWDPARVSLTTMLEDAADQGSSVGDGAGVGTFGRLFVGAGAALVLSLNIARATEEPMLLAEGRLVAAADGHSCHLAMTFAIVYADFAAVTRR